MGNGLIAFLVGLGAAVWTYNYFMKHTGSNTQRSLSGGAVVFILVFVILLTALGALSQN